MQPPPAEQPRTPAALIGRQAEQAAIARFVSRLSKADAARSGGEALLIEGPAGIGKTALWLASIEAARAAGVRVISARPAEAEATFPYAALADLLRGLLPEALPRLPAQQRRTLELALGIADDAAGTVDAQLVQLAASNALLSVAGRGPLLVAVDDAPWLDAQSAAVLQFLARRATGHQLGFVVAQRVEEATPAPFGLDEAVPAAAAERLWLEPLSVAGLHRLLAERLAMTLPRPLLVRLHQVSGGVPFHALEIGRALQRGPLPPIGAPLPIPPSLRELLAARVKRLARPAREALLLVAAGGVLPAATLEALMGAGPAREGLSIAIDEGLLSLEGADVRAGHPLIASVVYELATHSQRGEAHDRLARVSDEPEARARHRALASRAADEDVASELEAAGRRARSRGAPDAAAELLRLALERTTPANRAALGRRSLALAQALAAADDLPAAARSLETLIPELEPGATLAEAEILRSEISWYLETSADAVAHLEAALAAAAGDVDLEADIYHRLAIFSDFDLRRGLEHARRAVALLEGRDRPAVLSAALMHEFYCEVLVGLDPRVERLERALAIEPRPNPAGTTIPGIWWLSLDRHDEARQRFQSMLDDERALGQLSNEADLLTRLAEAELYADNYALARVHADEATAAARQHGSESADPARRVRALIDAYTGMLEEPAAVAESAAERTAAANDHIIAAAWLVVVGFVAASKADHAGVISASDRSSAHLAAIGIVEPLRFDLDHERLEALVALSRLDEAEWVLARLEERQGRFHRPWLAAAIVRGRALLHLARGELGEARQATEVVAVPASASWRRFDTARTLLVRGSVLRRQRARAEAGAAIDEAIRIFDALGAAGWADRARVESARLGRHRPGGEDLTPTEEQVARLAASGLTNREVADRLSISPKTVEAHVARIYSKLGIRSRAELGRRMAAATSPEVGKHPM